MSDFVSTPIADLVECNLPSLQACIDRVEHRDDLHAATLDSVYRYHLVQVFRRQADKETLAALSAHLGDVLHTDWVSALEPLEKPYLARWQAYRDILEGRLAARFKPLPALASERFARERYIATRARPNFVRRNAAPGTG